MAANPEVQMEPLLKKSVKYYENCPGCKIDRLKEMREGYPIKEFAFVGILVLCVALPISSLSPYLYFMIKDFHVAKTEADIGFYAGYIGSSFMFGRFLTSFLWGIAADKYGRKPVMMIGCISIVICITLFGLSTSFWMAISTRFMLGAFNGILGTVKAYASEVCREEHQAFSLSTVGTAWGIGLIIGPAIGGFFSQPAEKYPSIFSQDSLFGRFPYFLPCVCISVFATIVLVITYWLPETLHKHYAEDEEQGSNIYDLNARDVGENNPSANLTNISIQENKELISERKIVHKKSLLKNWPLIATIIIYCIFSLHDIAYTEIFSLWAVSPKEYGGLNFTTSNVGEILVISGLGVLVFQLLIFSPLAKLFGPILLIRIAAVLSISVLVIYPFISMLSGFLLWLVINCASLIRNGLFITANTATFLLLNNSVSQDQRGAANGLAMTAMSLFKVLGPAGGDSLFAWSEKRKDTSFLPGSQMVFFLLSIILFVGVILTFEPFLPRSTDKYQSNDRKDVMPQQEE